MSYGASRVEIGDSVVAKLGVTYPDMGGDDISGCQGRIITIYEDQTQ